MAARAYSYLRFSRPEQSTGDSKRRQRDLATKYCEEHGLELDERLSYADLGKSAYTGANVAEGGALRMFLDAIKDGFVPPGSVLLVEHLDRISRQGFYDTMPFIQAILNANVSIVTLANEKLYDLATVRSDPMAMIEMLLTLTNAQQFSQNMARRLRETWKNKRNTAEAKKLSKNVPSWLLASGDAKAGTLVFKKIPEKVKLVQRIFELAADGLSRRAITRLLNEEKIPTFTQRAPFWGHATIQFLLSFKAVLGIYEAHAWKNKRRVFERDVPDYYPAIIDQELWDRVQTLRKAHVRGGGPRKAPKHLFAGLATCPRCGGTMSRINKGNRNEPLGYLCCNRAHAKAGCVRRFVRIDKLTDAFMAQAGMLLAMPPTGDSFDEEIQNNEAAQLHIVGMLENVTDAITRSGGSETLLTKLGDLEQQQRDLILEGKALRQKQAESAHPVIEKKAATLRALLGQHPLDVAKANGALRSLFARVYVGEDGALHFQWHQGGETLVDFGIALPKKKRA